MQPNHENAQYENHKEPCSESFISIGFGYDKADWLPVWKHLPDAFSTNLITGCVCVRERENIGLNTPVQFTFFGLSILLKWKRSRICFTFGLNRCLFPAWLGGGWRKRQRFPSRASSITMDQSSVACLTWVNFSRRTSTCQHHPAAGGNFFGRSTKAEQNQP